MNRAEQARWEVERHATALDTALRSLAARALPDDIERIEADEDLVRGFGALNIHSPREVTFYGEQ